MPLSYWTEEDLESLGKINTFKGMLPVALGVLKRMPRPTIQVCGPVSTGGLGSAEANLAQLDKTIHLLIGKGKNVFRQVPFEEPIQRIKVTTVDKAEYAIPLLHEFYLPIFESGMIDSLYFLHDWESSVGANWEHEQGKRLGLEIVYLPEEVERFEG